MALLCRDHAVSLTLRRPGGVARYQRTREAGACACAAVYNPHAMGLDRYHAKRDFDVTPEPKGSETSKSGFSYVVQKHAASHLHYDFRLELDGVLLSWAVPKGPSLDPAVRRLAMQTEDHPVEYGQFEGTIPAAEYGGGTVMVWDHGTWEPLDDPNKAYAKGHLRFVLHGAKLRGGWHLVRAGRADEKKKGWLLFKSHDAEASTRGSIVDQQPNSTQTGRSLQEIARAADKIWHSNRASKGSASGKPANAQAGGTRVPSNAPAKAAAVNRGDLEALMKSAAEGPLPLMIGPQRPTLMTQVPVGPGWGHELKHDGYRMLARLEHGAVTLLTRNGNDWTAKAPSLAKRIAELPFATALFDGEIAVERPDGRTDFQLLQNALAQGRDENITFFLFDLLYLDGRDLRSLPLRERKLILEAATNANRDRHLRYSPHLLTSGADFLEAARKVGAEGIVSKRLDAPYRSGKGHDWRKIKCLRRQEFVIAGFTDPGGSRAGFGALLLGLHAGSASGTLVYAGRVGTGFSDETLKELSVALAPLLTKQCPFAKPPTGADARGAHWVRPVLVAEVAYGEITDQGLLRHPSFLGLRVDKPASEVALEVVETTSGREAPSKNDVELGPARVERTRSAAPTELTARAPAVRLTHPERVLYPKDGVTKQELADYYAAVSRWMLPHVQNRPLTLVRCPQGVGRQTFFQKHVKPPLAEPIRSIPIADDGATAQYMAIDDAAGLVSLAQMSVLEVHTWGAHADQPEKPDLLVFDLDPDPALKWEAVIACARLLREGLKQIQLDSYVKTTGGKGLHVCVPIERSVSWDVAKDFCRGLTELIVRLNPKAYVATMAKSQRTGKIFIDFFRNGRGATFIAPYSTRARDGAPVAVPLAWDELSPTLRADHFTVRNVMARMNQLTADPWKEASTKQQVLSASAIRAVTQPPRG